MELPPIRNIGWRVTLAGIGINLALGHYDRACIIAGVGLLAAAILLLLVKSSAPLAPAQPVGEKEAQLAFAKENPASSSQLSVQFGDRMIRPGIICLSFIRSSQNA